MQYLHTLKDNIAFVICDWLPSSACVWKKLFPEICFAIQLISFLQAASFCMLYHRQQKCNARKSLRWNTLGQPCRIPIQANTVSVPQHKLFLGNSYFEVVSTVSRVLFNEHHVPHLSLRMNHFFVIPSTDNISLPAPHLNGHGCLEHLRWV